MHLTGLDFLLWAASFVGQSALLFVLWFRRRALAFPFFTTYIASNVVRTIALYLVLHLRSRAAYFYTFWSLGIVDTVLQLCVVYEISSRIFRPTGSWAKDVRGSCLWLAGLSIATAAAISWLADPHTRFWMSALIIRSNLFSAVLMSELFVAMIALSVGAGLAWKPHVVKISEGLGLYSVVDFLIEIGHSFFGVTQGTQTYHDLSQMRIVVYIACVGYWIGSLWRDAPPPRELSDRMSRELSALQVLVGSQLQSLRSRRQS
jgi:hypothetical protein